MLKQAIVAALLAATALTSAPLRAEEAQHLTGKDDSGAAVGADVAPGTTTTLTIIQDPSATITTDEGNCPTQPSYYARLATATAMIRGKTMPLKSCELNKCTNPKLKKKCNDQPDYFKVNCTGSVDYQADGKIRVELDYPDEYWDSVKCQMHHKINRTSQVFLLWKPNPTRGEPQESEVGKKLDCYMHNLLYPVKDHPMHQDCGG